jgi:enoyl-CoA hydratase/carnithine racemase
MHLTLAADSIDADEAERIGLVSRVTEPETLLAEAEAFARRLASYPRVGVAWTKLGFHRALEGGFEDATRSEAAAELACFRSPDTRARFRAFLERKRE